MSRCQAASPSSLLDRLARKRGVEGRNASHRPFQAHSRKGFHTPVHLGCITKPPQRTPSPADKGSVRMTPRTPDAAIADRIRAGDLAPAVPRGTPRIGVDSEAVVFFFWYVRRVYSNIVTRSLCLDLVAGFRCVVQIDAVSHAVSFRRIIRSEGIHSLATWWC